MRKTVSLFICLLIIVGGCVTVHAGTRTRDGVMYSDDMTVLKYYPAAKTNSGFVLPETVTEIKSEAFSGNNYLKSVTLNNGLKKIGRRAFLGCTGLKKLVVPDSVERIGSQAFFECTGLRTVRLGDGLSGVGDNSFGGCDSLGSVYFGAKIRSYNGMLDNDSIASVSVSRNNSYYCAADGILFSKDKKTLVRYPCAKPGKKYTVPKYVRRIGDGAFGFNKNIKKLTVPKTVKKLADWSFYVMESLESINLGCRAEIIGRDCFGYCSRLKKLVLPSSVRRIKNSAFEECRSLAKLVLPDKLVNIGDEVDYNCKKLKSVTIPKSVRHIGSYAFGYKSFNEESEEYKKRPGFTVKGVKGTAAQKYAKENGFSFQSFE